MERRGGSRDRTGEEFGILKLEKQDGRADWTVIHPASEKSRHGPDTAGKRASEFLIDGIVVFRVEFAHVVAVDDVEVSILAGAYGKIPSPAGGILLGSDQSAAGAEIGIAVVLAGFVGEVEVEESIAVVAVFGKAAGVECGVESTVGFEQKDIAVTIGGHAGSGAPDRAFVAVRRDIEDRCLGESGDVVAHNPAGVRADVAMRGPGEIDCAADDEQAGALLILAGVEDDVAAGAVVAGAGIFGNDFDRAVVEFAALGGVEGVQALMVVSGFVFRHGDDVDDWVRVLWAENDRSRSNADFRGDLVAAAVIGRGFAGFQSGDVPDIGAGVGIVSIDSTVLARNDEQIVHDAGDGHGGNVQRLGVHQAVGGNSEELAELGRVDVG